MRFTGTCQGCWRTRLACPAPCQKKIRHHFTCTYEEWKSVYEGDLELRKQFMKDDIVGKVDENIAMIKATITDPEKMEKVMSERIPEIAPKLGLEHEMYTLTKMNN